MSRTCVAILYTTHHTLKAEKLLKTHKIKNKVIMKPRGVTTDCGLAIEFDSADEETVTQILRENPLKVEGVYTYENGMLLEKVATFH